jgi:hypothetical protein
MTVDGGVLVYGVAEDEASRVASEITPVPFAGLEEKLRQVSGSLTAPTPDFDVELIPSPEDESLGVAVVVVRASPMAPHQVGGRYPCRRGTTTDSLSEAEVQRLYRQRQILSGPAPAVEDLLSEFRQAPGTPLPVDGVEVGAVSLVLRPASSEVTHPAGAWQEGYLSAAVAAAARRQATRLANASLVRTWSALAKWEPLEADGWFANARLDGPLRGVQERHLSATLTYPARLSFLAQYPLTVAAGGGRAPFKTARETDVAYELVSMLAVAGEYFSEVDGGGHLLAAIRLSGFGGAESEVGRDSGWVDALPGAPAGIDADARTDAVDLRDEPEQLARRLVERWLPPFYRDALSDPARDLFQLVVPD